MAELSVLIVNYNSWGVCRQAIATLRENGPTRPDGSPMPYEVIVVDNASPRRGEQQIAAVEAELRLVREQQGDEQAGRLILHDENGGYSKGMNLAFEHSRGRWIVVSNPDVLFEPGCIPALQRHLENDPKAGICVPKGYWEPRCDGHLPPNVLPTHVDAWMEALTGYWPWLRHRRADRLARGWQRTWQTEEPLALPMMSGCLFLVERDYFESIGRFDERYPLYFEDADLSRKILNSGRTITQVPDAKLVHFVNRSGMTDLETMWARHGQSRERYFRKWYPWLGRLTLAVTGWLMTIARFAERRRIAPRQPLVDLGSSADKPVLEFGRHVDRYLVLMSLDLRFFLAAGIYGSGSSWTPTDEAFGVFVNAEFFFTAYDVSDGGMRFLGTWRYHSLSHLGRSVVERDASAAGAPS